MEDVEDRAQALTPAPLPSSPMSNSVNSFFENAAQQPELDQKIAAILTSSALSPADQAEALATLARASGSELTAADFRAAQSEISEEELAEVAGGRTSGHSTRYWETVQNPDGSYSLVRKPKT